MKFSDILMGLLIIIVFVVLHSAIKFLDFRKHIRNNWPEHRCNPAMMPFASFLGPTGTSAGLNHSQCVQTNMKSNIVRLIKPRLLGWSVVTLGMGIGVIVAACFVGEYTPQLAYWGSGLLLFGILLAASCVLLARGIEE